MDEIKSTFLTQIMVKVFKHNYLDELKQIMTIFPRKTVTIKLDDLEHITQKENIIF